MCGNVCVEGWENVVNGCQVESSRVPKRITSGWEGE
jgi:hypothetical protein